MRKIAREIRVVACVVLYALAMLCARVARADPTPPVDAACPPGELLAHAPAIAPGTDPLRLRRLTDGAVVREGSPWPPTELFVAVTSAVVFDLGRPTTIRQIFVQLDADQSVNLDFSTDQRTWTRLPVTPHATASGFVSRGFDVPAVGARYLRVSPGAGTSAVALSEVRAFCEHEPRLRRGLHVEGPNESPPSPGLLGDALARISYSSVVTPSQTATVKLVVVLLALAAAFVPLRRRGGAPAPSGVWKRPEPADVVFVLLALVGVGAYYGFGAYRYPNFVHEHDVFHYFVGAKYFPELGYDGLYECAAAAEADAGFRERVLARAQRDLRTNRIESGAEVLRRENECRARLGPARFAAFARDVGYFADTRSVEDWHRILRDHGFNATPTWIAAGRMLVRSTPATASFVGHGASPWSGVLVPLDVLLLVASLGALTYSFGCRTASMAAIVFACNPLAEFSWVGGGFLRELWLATLVFGLTALRRRRFATGGVLLALSSTLQLFPGVCLLAVALAAGLDWLRDRRIAPEARRTLIAAGCALVLAIPVSTAVAGRSDAWRIFATNTEKHTATPSGNLVGLPTALSFRMSSRAALLFDENAVDPFARLRAARRENLRALRPLGYAGAALGLAALARALRRRPEWWAAAALGLAMVPLVLETSSYYTAWLTALAVIGHRRTALLLPVLGSIAVALVLELTVGELDVRCGLASIALVAGVLATLALCGSTRFGLPARR